MKPAPSPGTDPGPSPRPSAVLAEHGSRGQGAGRRAVADPGAGDAAGRAGAPGRHQPDRRAGHGDRQRPSGVTVGALARHSRVEHDAAAARVQPLLRQALRLVAHPTIRNRGTTVGSLAHADPAGEMTAVLALCGGTRHRGVEPRAPGDRRGGLLPRAAGIGAGGRTSSRSRRSFPALPAECRHGVRRDRPPARRLRALRGRRHRRTRPSRRRLASLRCAYLSVFDTPLVLDLTAGLAVRRAGRRRAGPRAPSIRRPICTPPPTTAGISPGC